MNIDLHSHFFPVEALQNPCKYERHAPKLVLDKGKLSVTSQVGSCSVVVIAVSVEESLQPRRTLL